MSDPVQYPARYLRSRFCSEAACVEIAETGDVISMRNSRRPDQIIRFSRADWRAFCADLRRGEFD